MTLTGLWVDDQHPTPAKPWVRVLVRDAVLDGAAISDGRSVAVRVELDVYAAAIREHGAENGGTTRFIAEGEHTPGGLWQFRATSCRLGDL